ncbi:MAG: anthranilate phosphoribosyltransferase [Nitrospinales bacterium]
MDNDRKASVDERIKTYIGKIAVGPRQSKDLTEAEAQDALGLILDGAVSPARAAVLLIAARMKRETLAENIGYWRALDAATVKRQAKAPRLLQVADPFDGFNRTPYFGFYAIPVIAAMGLPAYGHSTLSLPPKFGITFQDILCRHYKVPLDCSPEDLIGHLEEHGFTFIGLRQSHPPLERLRGLREEIVKRPMLSTLEKLLQPLRAAGGENYLATGYFHKGYEEPMAAAARLAGFDKTLIGNGMEGTTLYGVHKPAKIFRVTGGKIEELQLSLEEMFSADAVREIHTAYAELKREPSRLDTLAAAGEAALQNASGPAAPLIACQAASLCALIGVCPNPQAGFDQAMDILRCGACYDKLMRFVQRGVNGNP